MTSRQTVTVTLNPDGVVQPALGAARLASEMLAMCLPTMATFDMNSIPNQGQHGLGFTKTDDAEDRRTHYRAWLLAKGFQELAIVVRGTLEQAFLYRTIFHQAEKLQNMGDLDDLRRQAERRANRLNMPSLIEAVEELLREPLQFRDELGSLQRTRNCLEHRNGVVGSVDCEGDPPVLTLQLPHLKAFIAQDGKDIELYAGLFIKEAGVVKIRRDTRIRQYHQGERIVFNAVEFNEIALDSWFFAQDVASKLPTRNA